MRKKSLNLVFVLGILMVSVLLFNIVSADFSVGNLSHNIKTTYGPYEDIQGWINISLDKENSTSVIKDSEN
jgi:hypothetical protein